MVSHAARRCALALSVLTAACSTAQTSPAGAGATAQPATPPKLIVLITVDQLRGDMLDRYRADLSKGYARLMTGGAWFTNAFHDHALTETAPGHASLLSGRFPASTGIVQNSAGVVDRNYWLLTSAPNEPAASPDRFIGTTLVDWLIASDPRTRALSVSRKDRGAILPVGRSKQQVYWFSNNGSFTTSNYYRDSLPAWVVAFNDRRIPHRYAGATWALSRPAASYAEPDSVPNENNGRDFVFPHVYPTDTARAVTYFQQTPSMDSLTALLALDGLEHLALGRGPQTDVLAVSFSATDYIGHAWGVDSREVHENEIRLDQTIGWFLDSLYRLRDSSSIVIALTGDHGASPIPELARARGQATGNQGLRVNLRPLVPAVRDYIRTRGGDTTAFILDGEMFAVDHARLRQSRLNPDSVLNYFRALALRVPGVARVDRIADLRRANHSRDPIARRWAHQLPQHELVDLVVTLTRYSVWSSTAVGTHGTPYDQDASVPIIFYGPWVRPGRYDEFARTVDIGVTLAQIAGVKPLERMDGVVLRKALK
jgi:predicted AlkP superfamily pyrophosphatase or phosphodiesterase